MRVPRPLSEPRLLVCWSNSSSAGFPLGPICCLLASLVLLASGPGGSTAEHFVVFWNSSNDRLLRSDYTLTVHINDYLDIYCPYYSNEAFSSDSGDSFLSLANRERYVLHMVNHTEFLACDAHKGFVRWNCDRPGAPGSGLKFSEKFHFVTPFSAGFEFRPGREYYYMSTPVEQAEDGSKRCFRLRISVCCPTKGHNDSPHSTNPPGRKASPGRQDKEHIEGRKASHGTRNGATKIRHSQWTQLAMLVLLVALSVTLHV